MKKILFIMLIFILAFTLFLTIFLKNETTTNTKVTETSNSLKKEEMSNSLKTKNEEQPPQESQIVKEEKEKKAYGEYQHLRYYNSDVHIYISGLGETLQVSTGSETLEKLADLAMPNEVAKINLGMFDSWFQHGGMYLVDGKYIQAPMPRYINLLYYKDGRIDIKKYDGSITKEEVETLRQETNFVVGTTYSLVQDGVKNLENAELFSHAKSKNPRTLFGQRADGRYVLAVVDGRKLSSKGVTAEQSAEIMLDLGCVEAINMDGGGSSSLRVNGELKSTPSEGKERNIGSALFVIH